MRETGGDKACRNSTGVSGVEMITRGGTTIQVSVAGVGPDSAGTMAGPNAHPTLRWSSSMGWWLAHGLLVALAILLPFPLAHGSDLHLGNSLTRWGVWQGDAVHYAHIAVQGYTASPTNPAFWPGVPVLVALTRRPWVTLAAVDVALLFVIRLVGTVAMDLGLSASTASIAVALFALNPAAVYYSTAYPELWVVGGFLLAIWSAMHRRPWPMAAGVAVATVMDPLGAVVGLLPLLLTIQSWRHRDREALRVGVAGVAAGGLVVLGFCGYLALTTGDPLAMLAAQRFWHGTWTFPGVQLIQETIAVLGGHSAINRAVALLVLVPTIPALVLGLSWLRSLRQPVALYAAITAGVMALIALAFEAERAPLFSTARFMSMVVPSYFGFARQPRLAGPVLLLGGLVALAGGVAFTHGYFWW